MHNINHYFFQLNSVLYLFIICILLSSIYCNSSDITINSKNKKDGKFYIYDWPSHLDDCYPPPGSPLDTTTSYSHDFYENEGAGKLLDSKNSYFATWQFSLYKNLMARLRVSKYRTLDPNEAIAFIVPYDPGVHSYIDHKTGRPRLASPHGWEAIRLLQKSSKDKETFWKMHGHNHFVFFSVTGYQMVGIGTKVFFMTICQNCTVLSIETAPGNIAIPGRTHKSWYSIPYPSSIHWWDGQKEAPWRASSSSSSSSTSDDNKRDILAIFIGSLKTRTAHSNMLRRKLYAQCGENSNCKWLRTAHSCTGLVGSNQSTVLLYRRTIFCLAPAGDSLTRKSVFDSYTTGCIPVIFARATLSQYFWHISESEIDESTVYIPKLDVLKKNVDFMKILESIPKKEIVKKQQAIARLAPRLQYSVVPEKYRAAKNAGNDPKQFKTWAPPYRDATDVVIEKLINPKTIEPVEGYTLDQLKIAQRKQREIMSTDPDYMGMSAPGTEDDSGKSKRKRKPKHGAAKRDKVKASD